MGRHKALCGCLSFILQYSVHMKDKTAFYEISITHIRYFYSTLLVSVVEKFRTDDAKNGVGHSN